MLGNSRIARYALDKRAHVFLFGNANMQVRCKSQKIMRKAIEINRYQRPEESIGVYGYCLLASNTTNILIMLIIYYKIFDVLLVIFNFHIFICCNFYTEYTYCYFRTWHMAN